MRKLEFDQYDQLSATKNRKTRESKRSVYCTLIPSTFFPLM